MKLAIWSYTAAVGLALLAVAALGSMFGNIYLGMFNGKPLPYLTGWVVGFPGWAPVAVVLLWVWAAAWLSRRGVGTPERVLAFAGVSTLALVFLFAVTAVALALPFFTIIVSLHG